MKAVDVLLRRYVHQNLLRADVRRQRQLDENAVDIAVAVELVDERQQFALGDRRRKQVLLRANADFFARFLFILDVEVRSWVVADKHHAENKEKACKEVGI